MRKPPMSSDSATATARILASGPTRIGTISLASAASITAPSEAASQGWATATLTGGPAKARASKALKHI